MKIKHSLIIGICLSFVASIAVAVTYAPMRSAGGVQTTPSSSWGGPDGSSGIYERGDAGMTYHPATGSEVVLGSGGGTVTTDSTLTGDGSSGTPLGIALGHANTWTAAQNVASVALTDGATISTNAALGNAFGVTLGGNRTIANPTNLVSGGVYQWELIQDSTGSRTVTWDTTFKWPGGGSAPTLQTAAGSKDLISCYYDGTDLLCGSLVGGSSGGGVSSITAGTGLTGGTIVTSGTIALDLTSANTWTALITELLTGVGTAQTRGFLANNSTAAAAGSQQYSPAIGQCGAGWKTNATAASQPVCIDTQVRPVQGAANPDIDWTIYDSINGTQAELANVSTVSSQTGAFIGGSTSTNDAAIQYTAATLYFWSSLASARAGGSPLMYMLSSAFSPFSDDVMHLGGASRRFTYAAIGSTISDQPTCDTTTRGSQMTVFAASGSSDTLQVCMKAAADTYAWRTVYTAP